MTGSSQEYVGYVLEQLEPIGDVSSGRFFGGIGLSCESVQFAMIMGNTLFFVVDETTRPRYEAEGMGCFSYNTKAKRVNVRKYYEVPAELVEDRDSLVEWARESIRVSRRLSKRRKTR